MADRRISDLTETTTLTGEALTEVSVPVTGGYGSRKVAMSTLTDFVVTTVTGPVDAHVAIKDAEIDSSIALADAARDMATAQGAYAASKGDYASAEGDYAKTQGDGAALVISQQVGNLAQTAADVVATTKLAQQVTTDKGIVGAARDAAGAFVGAAQTSATYATATAGVGAVADGAFYWAIDASGTMVRLYQRQGAGYVDTTITLPSAALTWQPLPRESGYLGGFIDAVGRAAWLVTPEGRFQVGRFVPGSVAGEALAQAGVTVDKLDPASVGAFLSQPMPPESGWAYAITDGVGRSPLLIAPDGTTYIPKFSPAPASVPLAALRSDVTGLFASPLPPESGYLWGIVDAANRVAGGVRLDGSFDLQKIDSPSLRGDYGADENANFEVVTYRDTAKKWQLRTMRRSDGQMFNLSLTSGSNYAPRLTEDDQVIFSSSAPVPGHYVVSAMGGTVVPLFSGPAISCFGDSLTYGVGVSDPSTQSWPAQLRILLGGAVTVNNYGIGGQTSSEIVARQGGMQTAITLDGNQIPASGAVAVTAYTVDIIFNNGAPGIFGTLAGVRGQLTSNNIQAHGGSTYVFTRTTAGDPVACPAGTPFLPELGLAARGDLQIIEVGRNNTSQQAQILADIAAAVAYLNARNKRFMVLTVLNAVDEPSGSAKYNTIMAINAAIIAAYPNNYVDFRKPPTTAEMSALNYVPTTQDLSDIANDMIPTGMRNSDGGNTIHLNIPGYALEAMRINNFLTLKGW